jgi:hypothetical protein
MEHLMKEKELNRYLAVLEQGLSAPVKGYMYEG